MKYLLNKNAGLFQKVNLSVLKFTLIALFIFVLMRTLLIFWVGESSTYQSEELLESYWLGFRFDIKYIATIVLIFVYLPLVLFLMRKKSHFLNYVHRILYIMLILILLITFMDFGYYLFFGNEIDMLVFGVIQDGTYEVIKSLFDDTRLIWIMLFFLLTVGIFSWMYRKIFPLSETKSHHWRIYIPWFITLVLLGLITRGSLGTFPLQKKTINTISDPFLASAVLNSPWHLYYTYKDMKKNYFSTPNKILKEYNLASVDILKERAGYKDGFLATTPVNPFLEAHPPHVIFVLMESWSTHIALQHSSKNNILGAFAPYAKKDYFFPNILSNAYGTNNTIEALLLNSPMKGVSQSNAQKTSFSMSSFLPFKENNYTTMFLSGGASTWRNHKRFWTEQGVDRYIGRAAIERHYHEVCDNTWGIYDEMLFSYLKEQLLNNETNAKPSFTFVLTTNNHPPIELPKNYHSPEFNLTALGFKEGDETRKARLQGYNYQSNAFGEFLRWLEASPLKDKVIVVATGDHIAKGYDDYFSDRMEYLKYAVATYFYIPEAYDQMRNVSNEIVASHNDLFPTIYHLALSHTKYYDFGTPFMFKDLKEDFGWNEQDRYIFNQGMVTNKNKFFKWSDKFDYPYELNTTSLPVTQIQQAKIIESQYQRILEKYLLTKEYIEKKRNLK